MDSLFRKQMTLEDLLLNSGLNEDCLVEILKRLNINDLLTICDFDSRKEKSFINLIKNRVIANITFDLDAIAIQRQWSIRRIFETFGNKITKIHMTVSLTTFNYLLEKITYYCDPNKLKNLHIDVKFGFQLNYDFNIMERMRPFLYSLDILHFKCENLYQKEELKSVFRFFLYDISERETLTIDGFLLFRYCSEDICRNPEKYKNITDLRFSNVNLELYIHRLIIYFAAMKSIKKFSYVQYNPQVIAVVGRELAKFYPELKSFEFVTHRFHCTNGYQYNQDFNILHSFGFLSELNHLEKLEMGADFNCRNIAELLAYTPNIKILSIYQIDFLSHMNEELDEIMSSIRALVASRYGYTDNRIRLIVNSKQKKYIEEIETNHHFVKIYEKQRKKSIVSFEF